MAVIDVDLGLKRKKKGIDIDFSQDVNPNSTEEERPSVNPVDEVSLGKLAQGLGAEVAISEGGRIASSLAFGPVGYVLGALGSGAAGSYAAQKITNPDDISEGRIIADAFINLIPGIKATKGTTMMADAVMRQGALGAGIGAFGVTGEKAFDEGRMPTIDELTSAGMTAGLLGGALGLSGAAVSKFLSKYQGIDARQLSKLDYSTDPADKTFIDRMKTLRERNRSDNQKAFDENYIGLQETISDASVRQRKLQDQYGGGQGKEGGPLKVREFKDETGFWTNPKDNSNIFGADQQDYYTKKRISEGKMDAQMELILKEEDLYSKELGAIGARIGGKTTKELTSSIDDYMYAKYAVDYNKIKGEGMSGMPTTEAKDIIKQFEGAGLNTTLANPMKILQNQNKRAQKLVVESGLVSEKQMNTWRKEYGDNYVPLTREIDNKTLLGSKAPNEVTSSGIYQDVGSLERARSIKQNIQENLADVIRRAELNKVNQSFARLVDANKVEAGGILKQTDNKNYVEGVGGKDSTLTFFKEGKAYNMEFADRTLARAFKGAPAKDMGTITKTIYNAASGLNRYLGSIYTRFNPDFVIPNLFRDSTEATVNNMARLGAKSALSLKSTSNPFSVFDKKTIYKKLNGQPPANAQEAEIHKMYDEFKADGGSVGGVGATTQQELTTKIENIAKDLQSGTSAKSIKSLGKWFDKANNIFEDGTRFKTYMMGRKSGMSRESAALAARDSSFDPRLGGTDVGWIRATYLFANPAIQANKVFLKNMYRNKKLAGAVFGSMVGVSYALDNWNSSIDPDWKEKLKTTTGSNFITNKSLVVVTGVDEEGKPKYVSMPIGYAMVPFKVLADYTAKSFSDNKPWSEEDFMAAGADISNQFLEGYNPTGGSLIPTPLRWYSELQANEDGLGRTIRPEWMESKNMAAKERMFSFTMDTKGGEYAYSLAETAEAMGIEISPESLIHLSKMFTGGPGGTMNKLLGIVSDIKNGKEIKTKDIPIIRRFMGAGYKDKFEERAGKLSEVEEFSRMDNTERAKDGRTASQLFREMKDSSPEEANAAIQRAMTEGILTPSVQKRLVSKIKNSKLNLTQTDSRVKQLSIPVRAKYLARQMSNMKLEDIETYMQDQITKRILTKDVARTLQTLKEFQDLKLQDLR